MLSTAGSGVWMGCLMYRTCTTNKLKINVLFCQVSIKKIVLGTENNACNHYCNNSLSQGLQRLWSSKFPLFLINSGLFAAIIEHSFTHSWLLKYTTNLVYNNITFSNTKRLRQVQIYRLQDMILLIITLPILISSHWSYRCANNNCVKCTQYGLKQYRPWSLLAKHQTDLDIYYFRQLYSLPPICSDWFCS